MTKRYFLNGFVYICINAGNTDDTTVSGKSKYLKAEVYEHLAFTDGLTELNNRLSFENDINECIGNNRPACISIDLNNLKRANDTMQDTVRRCSYKRYCDSTS